MKALIFVLMFGAVLTGCKDEEVRTKQWYIDNDSERQAKVQACENDAKERATANCQNAIEADRSIWAMGKNKMDNSSPKIHIQ